MMKKKIGCLITACFVVLANTMAQKVITIPPGDGDMTKEIQVGIDEAKRYQGDSIVINLCNADYHIYRKSATPQVYYASNTMSEAENPDQTKHIGLWLKDMEHITIDGRGARIITHGEMTPFVIDQCRQVTFRNFTLVAADPTVPEMTVREVDDCGMTVEIHSSSNYQIDGKELRFIGEGWSFSQGIAQIYDPQQDIVWRSWSPLSDIQQVEELEPRVVRLEYGHKPDVLPGQVFQMRDAIRDEVSGLIQYSKDITLENVHLAFLGNFGVLSQLSENITYRNLSVEPELGSGRTCAAFADILHFSGCRGKIVVEDSRFSASQDDAINIHGTHLQVTGFPASDQIVVSYMHPQTYGFQSIFKGDELAWVDVHSLLPSASFRVKNVEKINLREWRITLDRPVPSSLKDVGKWVVENISYTPEVLIRHNLFFHIPTRGILVTTRNKVLIEGNVFFRPQMSSILIADDARSWFESGAVKEVTIRNNRFIEGNHPLILIAPENDVNRGCVHGNIRIENNYFQMKEMQPAINAKSVEQLIIEHNNFQLPESGILEQLVQTKECGSVSVQANQIIVKHKNK